MLRLLGRYICMTLIGALLLLGLIEGPTVITFDRLSRVLLWSIALGTVFTITINIFLAWLDQIDASGLPRRPAIVLYARFLPELVAVLAVVALVLGALGILNLKALWGG